MNTIYASELAGYRRDSQNSIESYRLRKHMESKWSTVIVFFAMPLYMIGTLSWGKKISVLGAIAISAVTLSPIHFV